MADLESVCRFRFKGCTPDFETPENRKDGFVYGIICQEEKTELFLPDLILSCLPQPGFCVDFQIRQRI